MKVYVQVNDSGKIYETTFHLSMRQPRKGEYGLDSRFVEVRFPATEPRDRTVGRLQLRTEPSTNPVRSDRFVPSAAAIVPKAQDPAPSVRRPKNRVFPAKSLQIAPRKKKGVKKSSPRRARQRGGD